MVVFIQASRIIEKLKAAKVSTFDFVKIDSTKTLLHSPHKRFLLATINPIRKAIRSYRSKCRRRRKAEKTR